MPRPFEGERRRRDAVRHRETLAAALTADLQAARPDAYLRLYVYGDEPPAATKPPNAAERRRPDYRDRTGAIDRTGHSYDAVGAPEVAYISFEHFDDRSETLAAVRRLHRLLGCSVRAYRPFWRGSVQALATLMVAWAGRRSGTISNR